MKKVLSLLMVITILVSACGSSGGDGDDKLVIWAWDPSYNIPVLEEAQEIYQAEYPDTEIEIVEMAKEDIEQALHTSLSTGTTEGLPDIVLIEDYNSQLYLESYPDAFYGMSEEVNYDDFLDYKVETCSIDDETYCMPFDSGVTGMFYRTDIFGEAGYNAEDLNGITWDEFFVIAEDVYEQTGTQVFTYDPSDGGILRLMLQSGGSWYTDERYENLSDNPVYVKSLEYNKEIQDADWAKEAVGWTEFIGAFNSGDVAAVPNGAWVIASIKLAEDQSGDWGVAEVPRLDIEEGTNYSNVGGSSFYVLNGLGDEELATDFLNTGFTNVELYENILSDTGANGSYIPAQDSDVYQYEDPFFGGQKVNETLGAWSQEIPPVTYGKETYALDDATMANFEQYRSGEINVEELLDVVQETVGE